VQADIELKRVVPAAPELAELNDGTTLNLGTLAVYRDNDPCDRLSTPHESRGSYYRIDFTRERIDRICVCVCGDPNMIHAITDDSTLQD
jgi:hypothetical protein